MAFWMYESVSAQSRSCPDCVHQVFTTRALTVFTKCSPPLHLAAKAEHWGTGQAGQCSVRMWLRPVKAGSFGHLPEH